MARELATLLARLADQDSPPLVMGILNLTPDSFHDGGRWLDGQGRPDPDQVARAACRMVEAGAEILDLGGESTRPGSTAPSMEVELARVLPALEALPGDLPAWLSVDTRRLAVAREAAWRGAVLVNDVGAGSDPGLWPWLAGQDLGYVLMHMQGQPATMQQAPAYRDCVGEVRTFLQERSAALAALGVSRERILLDPGIGFGKRLEDNGALLRGLAEVRDLGHPLLLGASRKSFIAQLESGQGARATQAAGRLGGSVAVALWAARAGVRVLRVHDVEETVQALRVQGWLEERPWS
jgi:dihydropteroate synthase